MTLTKEESPQPDTDGDQLDTDYVDLDLVEFNEDLSDVAAILKPSQVAKDKLTFTVMSANICLTGFLVGYVPNYAYIWYTIKALILLPYRLHSYKKTKDHYFMLDFCYFVNTLTLLYLWLPSGWISDYYRGGLFMALFGFSMGPLMVAVALWRNSLVPHSTDKMTSLFIHVSPGLSLWGIRWFSSEDQGFPLCPTPTEPGPRGCDHMTIKEIAYIPMLLYAVWQIFYIAVVFVWRKERVAKRRYSTSYHYLVEQAKKGFLYKLFNVFGPRYAKPVFVTWQCIYTTLSILAVYLYYHNNLWNIVAMMIFLTIASHNGASFYFDVFSQRYYFEKVLKIKPPSQSTLKKEN